MSKISAQKTQFPKAIKKFIDDQKDSALKIEEAENDVKASEHMSTYFKQ